MEFIPLMVAVLSGVPEAQAQAVMSSRELTVPSLGPYLYLVMFAMLGGVINFWRKVRAGTARWINVNELVGEIVTSGFVGAITGFLLTAADAPPTLVFGAAGIAGHLGSRAIFWAEQALQQYAEKRLGIKVDLASDKAPTP